MGKLFAIVTLLVCAPVLTACVASQDDMNALNQRLGAQEQRLASVNTQLSGVQPAQADMWSQMQDVLQDIAEIKGRLDSLEHNSQASADIEQIRDRLNRQEQALRLVASEFALDLPMLDPESPAPQEAVEPAPTPDPGVPAVPAVPADPATPAPAVTSDTATVLYEQGVALFNEREYESALRNFKDFADVYPTHPLAPNALFWQGETNYQLKNYAAAALAYEQVIAKFPRSSKYSSALLKQGICFYGLGQADAGKTRLNEVIAKFPGTPEATRAKKFLEDNPA